MGVTDNLVQGKQQHFVIAILCCYNTLSAVAALHFGCIFSVTDTYIA